MWMTVQFPHRRHGGLPLRINDLATALPLLMLLLSVFSLLIGPATLALSRYHEHEADRFALELTHDNRGGASAFVALQRQNLAVPRPGWLFKLFRESERIYENICERLEEIFGVER